MQRLKGLSILVVDDEALLREIVNEDLTCEGAIVTEAASGFDAIKILLDKSFDVVLSDVRMANGSGLDVLYFLNDPSRKKPKTIIITAYAEKTFGELYQHGADAIFSKPCDFEEVIQNILRMNPGDLEKVKRNWDRIDVSHEVEITAPLRRKVIPAQMKNVCVGGMGIQLVNYVPELGEEILFRWSGLDDEDPNRSIVGRGICRWIRAADGGFFNVGVEFKETAPDAVAWVIERVARRDSIHS